MAKSKREGEHNVEFAKGGSTHMFGPQKAGQQASGETETESGQYSGDKFACGGSGKMFGFAGSQPAKSGQTGAR